jgi:predicted O-linked N-acetylglucosamine transferase (SPINDLY family)
MMPCLIDQLELVAPIDPSIFRQKSIAAAFRMAFGPTAARRHRFGLGALPTLASAPQKAALLARFEVADFQGMHAAASALVAMFPNDGKVWHWLGVACLKLNLDEQAEPALRRASELLPQDANVWDHLGLVLCRLMHHPQADVCFERSVALDPACVGTWGNAAKNANEMGDHVAGARYARQGLAQDPASYACHVNLAHALRGMGRAGDAAQAYRQALRLPPHDFGVASSLLVCLSLDESLAPPAVFAEHVALMGQFEAPFLGGVRSHQNNRDPGRRLRVGFVSGDLCSHPVASFVHPVWAALNSAQVAVWTYATSATVDQMTGQLRALTEVWREVHHLSDEALAGQIRADGIDVLIDLSGHTRHNRLLTFARKPAPVQATWIGYPNTTGLQAMDYVLADRFNSPHGLYEQFYVEKFARLPSSGTFAPAQEAPPVNGLPALRNGFVTFGSFNNTSKLGDQVIAVWSQVLRAVPGSRLVMGNVSAPALAQQFTERFGRQGIAADRLTFKPYMPMLDYLALHHEVDLILDSWPYTGGTTTNHALWMGVPVVTLQGPSRSHCQSAAVLGRMGMQDWVTLSEADFVALAVQWANAPLALSAVRAGLRERWQTAPLRQPATVARGLEQALRVMWQRWCAGLPAADFEISA